MANPLREIPEQRLEAIDGFLLGTLRQFASSSARERHSHAARSEGPHGIFRMSTPLGSRHACRLARYVRAIVSVALLLCGIRFGHADPVPLPPAPARPDAAAGPTKVEVGGWLADILRIDSAAQTFTVNMLLVMQWRDPALASAAGTPPRSFALSEIWSPRWLPANPADALQKPLPEVATVTADGTVVYRQSLIGSFAQPMNLRRFPFDRETFRIRFVVPGYSSKDIAFLPSSHGEQMGLRDGVGHASNFTMQDWKVTNFHARAEPYTIAPGEVVAGYTIEFDAARKPNHYVLKVLLPLVLIVMMSWLVFWIDPTLSSAQISVAVTSMLTLIAYRFAIGADVPKLPYLTLLDAFILLSSILVFLSLIEVMVTTALALNNRVEAARALDRHSRWVFPLVFLVVSALLTTF